MSIWSCKTFLVPQHSHACGILTLPLPPGSGGAWKSLLASESAKKAGPGKTARGRGTKVPACRVQFRWLLDLICSWVSSQLHRSHPQAHSPSG